jgi:epoxyqueuosine reductase QueG
LGNSKPSTNKIEALSKRLGTISDMVDEHIVWAMEKQRAGLSVEDGTL